MTDEHNETNGDLGDLSEFKASSTEYSARGRRKAKRGEEPGPLNINSLMDILTVLVMFLIKSYSATPVNITQGEELTLPDSTAQLDTEDATPIAITARQILVADRAVANIRNNRVDPVHKDGEDGYLIRPVRDALEDEAEAQSRVAAANPGVEFTGTALLIAHRETSFRTISEVLYSAGQANFNQFKFTVIKRDGM